LNFSRPGGSGPRRTGVVQQFGSRPSSDALHNRQSEHALMPPPVARFLAVSAGLRGARTAVRAAGLNSQTRRAAALSMLVSLSRRVTATRPLLSEMTNPRVARLGGCRFDQTMAVLGRSVALATLRGGWATAQRKPPPVLGGGGDMNIELRSDLSDAGGGGRSR